MKTTFYRKPLLVPAHFHFQTGRPAYSASKFKVHLKSWVLKLWINYLRVQIYTGLKWFGSTRRLIILKFLQFKHFNFMSLQNILKKGIIRLKMSNKLRCVWEFGKPLSSGEHYNRTFFTIKSIFTISSNPLEQLWTLMKVYQFGSLFMVLWGNNLA